MLLPEHGRLTTTDPSCATVALVSAHVGLVVLTMRSNPLSRLALFFHDWVNITGLVSSIIIQL